MGCIKRRNEWSKSCNIRCTSSSSSSSSSNSSSSNSSLVSFYNPHWPIPTRKVVSHRTPFNSFHGVSCFTTSGVHSLRLSSGLTGELHNNAYKPALTVSTAFCSTTTCCIKNSISISSRLRSSGEAFLGHIPTTLSLRFSRLIVIIVRVLAGEHTWEDWMRDASALVILLGFILSTSSTDKRFSDTERISLLIKK